MDFLIMLLSPVYLVFRTKSLAAILVYVICLAPLWPAFKKYIDNRRQEEREKERRPEILRLVKERNHRFTCNDESYKDIQGEINKLTSDMKPSEKKELDAWLAAQINT